MSSIRKAAAGAILAISLLFLHRFMFSYYDLYLCFTRIIIIFVYTATLHYVWRFPERGRAMFVAKVFIVVACLGMIVFHGVAQSFSYSNLQVENSWLIWDYVRIFETAGFFLLVVAIIDAGKQKKGVVIFLLVIMMIVVGSLLVMSMGLMTSVMPKILEIVVGVIFLLTFVVAVVCARNFSCGKRFQIILCVLLLLKSLTELIFAFSKHKDIFDFFGSYLFGISLFVQYYFFVFVVPAICDNSAVLLMPKRNRLAQLLNADNAELMINSEVGCYHYEDFAFFHSQAVENNNKEFSAIRLRLRKADHYSRQEIKALLPEIAFFLRSNLFVKEAVLFCDNDFVIVLNDAEPGSATKLIDKLKKMFSLKGFKSIGDRQVLVCLAFVRLSVGESARDFSKRLQKAIDKVANDCEEEGSLF